MTLGRFLEKYTSGLLVFKMKEQQWVPGRLSSPAGVGCWDRMQFEDRQLLCFINLIYLENHLYGILSFT